MAQPILRNINIVRYPRNAMRVVDLIRRPPITVPKGTAVRDAARLMVENGVGLLVIEEGQRVVGVISERDVVRAVARGLSESATVEQVGTMSNLVHVSPSATIYDVAAAMVRAKVRHVLVMDGERLVGVVSIRDIVGEAKVLDALARLPEAEHGTGD